MINISITKLSSKGQLVIPAHLRKGLSEGDEFLVVRDENRIILKKADKVTEEMKDDLEFAQRTGEALERYDRGEFISLESNNFLKKMDTW